MNKQIAVQRKLTSNLINSFPLRVSLSRAGTLTPNGVGGMKRVGPPEDLPSKVYYFSGVVGPPRFAVTENGKRLEADHVLIGAHDDDIRAGDEFDAHGSRFRVVWVEDDRRYQTKAMVIRVSGGDGG